MAFAITEIKKTSGKATYRTSQRDYAVEYQVKFTGTYDEALLLSSAGITVGGVTLPAPSSVHPNDDGVYLSSIDVSLVDESSPLGVVGGVPGVATYAVTYTSNQFEQFGVHPLDRPAIIQWRGGTRTQVLPHDVDGNPLVNSAGDLLDPLPESPLVGGECVITMNVEFNPGNDCVLFSNHTNSADFYGLPAKQGLIGQMEASKQFEVFAGATVEFWQLTVPITIIDDTWHIKPIDNGFKYINDDDKKQVSTDDLGSRTPVAILLDGSGGELADADTPVVYPTAGYEIIRTANWATLDLPNPF